MGAVLDKLASGAGGTKVVIDFENATPTDEEKRTYDMVDEVLGKRESVMRCIDEYKGCQELARKAMQEPTPENEAEAFEGLLAAVDSIHTFYLYAKELEKVLPELLTAIGTPKAGATSEGEEKVGESQTALYKQLADVFNFAIEFDAVRMQRPNLSNDFSYYRRLLPKFSKNDKVKIRDDEASAMAMFTAQHIPMMNCLAKAGGKATEQNESVTQVLAIMANSCHKMLKTKRFENEATNLLCARAMVGAIVLFDHVDTLGVFHRKSAIPIKPPVMLLKKDFPKEGGLLNAIHFSTKHFNEASQPVQDLFD